MSNKISVYLPDNSLRKGYFFIFKEIFNEIKDNKWLTYQLFKRDFFAIYKQSFIGFFWAIIVPLVSVGTFILLNRSGIFSIGKISMPYPIYAILGLAFWQLFAAGIVAGSNSLVKAGGMITKINFSKKSLVIASMGQAIISFIIQIVFVLVLFAAYKVSPNIKILLIPVLLLPVLLFTIGIGFILALLNGIFRDISNILSILITFLMFLTPILYVKPKSGLLMHITNYNPLYYLVAAPRDIIISGSSPAMHGFLISTFFSVFIFIFCIVAFHLTETRVAERI